MPQKSYQELLQDIARDVLDIKSDIVDIKRSLLDLSFSNPSKLSKSDKRGMRTASKDNVTKETNVRVVGTVLSEARRPLAGVQIKIFDYNNNVVAQTKSDQKGEWSTFVKNFGSYSIEYARTGKVPHNINIKIPEGQSYYKIAKGR